MAANTLNVSIVGITPPKRRPGWAVRLGCKINPESVKEAWYAADCPKVLDMSAAGIPVRDRLVWRVSCFLRGCRRAR